MTTTSRPTPVWHIAIIALIAGVLGGVSGALLASPSPDRSVAAGGQVDTAHGQDIIVCTTYALVKKTVREDDPTSVLAAIPPLRMVLTENPDANTQLREGVLGAVEALDAILSKDAVKQGLSHPLEYDPKKIKTAFDRMAEACDLSAAH